ncbi:hypothetical protein FBY40_3086 [Microbacterium sp. SLBN-154]|nr:hypothetical protein [Microbacterium sp. SLBN-154]TQK20549.1 hypothetical protein FBY40_3086 [Microbacterium sp. SLBN-154]
MDPTLLHEPHHGGAERDEPVLFGIESGFVSRVTRGGDVEVQSIAATFRAIRVMEEQPRAYAFGIFRQSPLLQVVRGESGVEKLLS